MGCLKLAYSQKNEPVLRCVWCAGEQSKNRVRWYDYGARFYDAQIGRFTTIDTKTEKFRFQSPYCYAANIPTRLIDINGEAPGDPFRSATAAAIDFAKTYNGASILTNREYASTIYRYRKDGKLYYSYSEPNIDNYEGVNPSHRPLNTFTYAYVHTHTKYVESFGEGNNVFSDPDKWTSIDDRCHGYLVTPNGTLQFYDYVNHTTTLLRTDIPSDPNDPDRKNKLDPVNLQEKYVDPPLEQQKRDIGEMESIRMHKSNLSSWSQVRNLISYWLTVNPNIKVTVN